MKQKQKMSAHATSGICRVITSFYSGPEVTGRKRKD